MANVLLVDDNESLLLTLSIALRRHGHVVATAPDAMQALALLKTRDFDFLLTDVRMPGMSGVELADQARDLPHPPLIILTSAYSNLDIRNDADAFLRKPLDIDHLLSLLKKTHPSRAGKSFSPPPVPRPIFGRKQHSTRMMTS